MIKVKNICCIGAGYVGGPTMSVIADRCPQIKVNVVDINKDRIKSWNSKNLEQLPIYEPGLSLIVSRRRGKNLFFSSNIESHIASADIVFISVNTPTKKKGLGAGQASNLKWVEKCARQVAQFSNGYTIVVEKSTLPVKTAEVIKEILAASQLSTEGKNKKSFDVLSNPEFLAEGTAIQDLENPDRVLIGGDNIESMNALKNIYTSWVPKEKILFTNIWSSELAKLTANAFLAQRISSINSIAALCEPTGAHVTEVAEAIGFDSRIGSKFLNPSPGFGGSCFQKDLLNLVYLCKYYGLEEVSDYWEQVIKLNNWQNRRISQLIVEKLFGTVSLKKIVILGFSFKANTNDTRESPAISIVNDLLENGAEIKIHDPKVKSKQIMKDLNLSFNTKEKSKEFGSWDYVSDLYKALENADAAVIVTEWPEYKKLDWLRISEIMRKPAWLFDTRSITEPTAIKETSINYWSVGNGSLE